MVVVHIMAYLDADPQGLEYVDGGAGLVLGQSQLEILEAVAASRASPGSELPWDMAAIINYLLKLEIACSS